MLLCGGARALFRCGRGAPSQSRKEKQDEENESWRVTRSRTLEHAAVSAYGGERRRLHWYTLRLALVVGVLAIGWVSTSLFALIKSNDKGAHGGASGRSWREPAYDPAAKVAVVGAGASGLSAALLLHLSGRDVTIYEATDHLGGHSTTVR